jgi:hypothetical protein
MSAERRTPSAPDPASAEDDAAHVEHPAKPVDPFRKQLDSQPREMSRPGQSGFFRPQLEDGRYSLRDVPVESVQVRGSTSSTPPAPSTAPAAPPRAQERPAEELIVIPPTLRDAAERWRRTGSFPLPAQASSRHARAWQRAMLAALMRARTEEWPATLIQRAAWLFRGGWDSDPVEFDSCLALLDLPNTPQIRAAMLALISAHNERHP